VRSKVFPFKRKKVNAEEAESPITLPVKVKERSISSLVVNTPRVAPAASTRRRTRAVTRKAAALRGLGPIIVDPLKKDNDNSNKQTDNSSLLDSLSKIPQTRRQVIKYSSILIISYPVMYLWSMHECVSEWNNGRMTNLTLTFAVIVEWGYIKSSLC
jgi:hypothetical protein